MLVPRLSVTDQASNHRMTMYACRAHSLVRRQCNALGPVDDGCGGVLSLVLGTDAGLSHLGNGLSSPATDHPAAGAGRR